MARPTKYNAAMQKKAEEYLTDFAYSGDVIPSVEGLAEYLEVGRATLYVWGGKTRKFQDTLDRIQEKQKNVTLNHGLDGTFNATIAKLVLANHGMHDKQDTTHDVKGDLADALKEARGRVG